MSPQNCVENLAVVNARMTQAAERAGRGRNSVTLVAVSKGQPAGAVRAAYEWGVRDFGENYLQEALPKMDALAGLDIHWHFIGRIQSNKTRVLAERFEWVHGVDRLQIARRLSEQRPFHAPPLNICLQVKLEDEDSKGGVAADELPALAAGVSALERVRLRGLMCMPPASEDVSRQHEWFRRMRELRDALNRAGHSLDTLSMGMSGDFEAAIEEGATHVRIGTAIFGQRGRIAEL